MNADVVENLKELPQVSQTPPSKFVDKQQLDRKQQSETKKIEARQRATSSETVHLRLVWLSSPSGSSCAEPLRSGSLAGEQGGRSSIQTTGL